MKLLRNVGKSDIAFDIVSYASIIIGCLVVLYPLYFIVIASISDPALVMSGKVTLFPKGLTLAGYRRILRYGPLLVGYRNSLYYAVFGAILSSSLTLLAAYPLSRKDFSGRRFFTVFILITMFFQGGLIPLYIVVNSLRMRNTFAVLLVVNGIQVWNLLIASSYFKSTSIDGLFEASQVDGCTHFGYFFKILLPVSKPIIIVELLFYGVWQWNDFFRGMIYLDKQEYFPLQLILKNLLAENTVSTSLLEMMAEDQAAFGEFLKAADSMKYGMILFATLPMLVLYLILQEYFIQGITMGSVKE